MKFLQFLNEAPLPDSCDKNKFNGKINYKEMIEYA